MLAHDEKSPRVGKTKVAWIRGSKALNRLLMNHLYFLSRQRKRTENPRVAGSIPALATIHFPSASSGGR
jgi:hypothetical protein